MQLYGSGGPISSKIPVILAHSFVSILYHYANKHRIKYVLNGSNIATESVFPSSWHHDAMDSINLKAIHRKYGEKKLKHFKPISFFQYYFWYPIVMNMTVLNPLNLVYYNPEEVKEYLIKNIGYKPYGRKHGESGFTKFFQNYFLVNIQLFHQYQEGSIILNLLFLVHKYLYKLNN